MFNFINGSIGLFVTNMIRPYCPHTGVMRWNHTTQAVEVMGNGNDWYRIPDTSTMISLDPNIQSVVIWATKKMKEEQDLSELCATHPGLQDTKEKYEIMLALVRKEREGVVGSV